MARDGKRNSMPNRLRLVGSYNRGKDYKTTARTLGIKSDTAYRIVKNNSVGSSQRRVHHLGKGKFIDNINLLICSLVDAKLPNAQSVKIHLSREKVRDTTGVALSDTTRVYLL